MKKFVTVLTLAFLMALSLVKPVSVKADTADLETGIDAYAQLRVDNNTTPGVTVLVKKGDEILHHKSYGYAFLYDREHNPSDLSNDVGVKLENPIVMTNETLYDLASVTKVAATTQAMMILVSRGLVDLDEPVATYLPGFGTKGKEIITSRDLLTHTSGLPQWEPSYLHVNTREGEKEYVNNLEMNRAHGSYAYSDFGFMILGFIVEEVSGSPLELFLEENLYGPLGMSSTMFVPLENGVSEDNIAATSWGNPYEWRMSNQRDYNIGYNTAAHQEAFDAFDGWRWYTLRGEVNDGNAGMANEGVAGHAGLFSTALDLSKLGDMMLSGGTYEGITFYDEATFNEFTTKDPSRNNRGLGWYIGIPSATSGYIGAYASDSTFGHDGFTGTQVIFDKDYDLQIIILSNKQNYGPYNTNGSYYSTYTMSREISTLVYEYIIDASSETSKDELQALYETTLALDTDLYVDDTLQGLEDLLIGAEEILNDEFALQIQVDKAFDALKNFNDQLIKKGDKTLLITLVDSIESNDLSNMTEPTLKNLKTALNNSKAVLANLNATQETVDASYDALLNAYESLIEKGNKDALISLIEKVIATDLDKMTVESSTAFKNALTKATTVVNDDNAMQEAIDVVLDELQRAFDNLEAIKDTPDGEELPDTGSSALITYMGISFLLVGFAILFVKPKKKFIQ